MAHINVTNMTTSGCCCGSPDCAFLEHNAKLLSGLERHVSQAAQLGQALLVRHEEYVADSERERKEMTWTINYLEAEKRKLEDNNTQTIKENRDLLDQLEHLNETVAASDAHIQALADTLESTEQEIERLSLLAARTQMLEKQLMDLEREQSQLQINYDAKLIDERTAIQRWKNAERAIEDLQHQVDRIEKEGREEKERHIQVVARMERRIAVEGELNTTAGILKAKGNQDKAGTNVVSHFVKDILVDNANLQHGIVELREMLMNSNEEVEHLRDQLKVHRPVSSHLDNVMGANLQSELDCEGESVLNQELHIHHHYHGTKASKNPAKLQAHRKPKKKRFSLSASHFDPPQLLDRSSSAATLSQTAVTVPHSHRWSQASSLTVGSFPGSPTSDSHRGSVYDRVFSDAGYDSSRPTSPPDSVATQSPILAPLRSNDNIFDNEYTSRHHWRKSSSLKPLFMSAFRANSTPIPVMSKASPATAVISAISPANPYQDKKFPLSANVIPEPQSMILEENEDSIISMPDPFISSQHFESTAADDLDPDLVGPPTTMRPALRRHASHESLISVSGMDIHTLQSRPSQLLYLSSPHFTTPQGAGSVRPEVTPWTVTAYNTLSRKNHDSSALNRSLLYSSLANQQRISGNNPDVSGRALGFGKKVGGWVFGKWGSRPAPASDEPSRPPSLRSQSSQGSGATAISSPSKESPTKKKTDRSRLRPSGVNQSGSILGVFADVVEVQTRVVVENYDSVALGEALAES